MYVYPPRWLSGWGFIDRNRSPLSQHLAALQCETYNNMCQVYFSRTDEFAIDMRKRGTSLYQFAIAKLRMRKCVIQILIILQ